MWYKMVSPVCTFIQSLLSLGGVQLLLEVVQSVQPSGERSSHDHELLVQALQVLQLAALSPYARRAIAGGGMQAHTATVRVTVCDLCRELLSWQACKYS